MQPYYLSDSKSSPTETEVRAMILLTLIKKALFALLIIGPPIAVSLFVTIKFFPTEGELVVPFLIGAFIFWGNLIQCLQENIAPSGPPPQHTPRPFDF